MRKLVWIFILVSSLEIFGMHPFAEPHVPDFLGCWSVLAGKPQVYEDPRISPEFVLRCIREDRFLERSDLDKITVHELRNPPVGFNVTNLAHSGSVIYYRIEFVKIMNNWLMVKVRENIEIHECFIQRDNDNMVIKSGWINHFKFEKGLPDF